MPSITNLSGTTLGDGLVGVSGTTPKDQADVEIALKAVRHDVLQSLSSDAKQRARANIGEEPFQSLDACANYAGNADRSSVWINQYTTGTYTKPRLWDVVSAIPTTTPSFPSQAYRAIAGTSKYLVYSKDNGSIGPQDLGAVGVAYDATVTDQTAIIQAVCDVAEAYGLDHEWIGQLDYGVKTITTKSNINMGKSRVVRIEDAATQSSFTVTVGGSESSTSRPLLVDALAGDVGIQLSPSDAAALSNGDLFRIKSNFTEGTGEGVKRAEWFRAREVGTAAGVLASPMKTKTNLTSVTAVGDQSLAVTSSTGLLTDQVISVSGLLVAGGVATEVARGAVIDGTHIRLRHQVTSSGSASGTNIPINPEFDATTNVTAFNLPVPTGMSVTITDGVHTETKTAAAGSTTSNIVLSSGLTYTYAAGATVYWGCYYAFQSAVQVTWPSITGTFVSVPAAWTAGKVLTLYDISYPLASRTLTVASVSTNTVTFTAPPPFVYEAAYDMYLSDSSTTGYIWLDRSLPNAMTVSDGAAVKTVTMLKDAKVNVRLKGPSATYAVSPNYGYRGIWFKYCENLEYTTDTLNFANTGVLIDACYNPKGVNLKGRGSLGYGFGYCLTIANGTYGSQVLYPNFADAKDGIAHGGTDGLIRHSKIVGGVSTAGLTDQHSAAWDVVYDNVSIIGASGGVDFDGAYAHGVHATYIGCSFNNPSRHALSFQLLQNNLVNGSLNMTGCRAVSTVASAYNAVVVYSDTSAAGGSGTSLINIDGLIADGFAQGILVKMIGSGAKAVVKATNLQMGHIAQVDAPVVFQCYSGGVIESFDITGSFRIGNGKIGVYAFADTSSTVKNGTVSIKTTGGDSTSYLAYFDGCSNVKTFNCVSDSSVPAATFVNCTNSWDIDAYASKSAPTVAPDVTAAGVDQSTATALSSSYNNHVVTTATAGQGVKLPTASSGVSYNVYNATAVDLLCYPPSGADIDAGSTNAAVTIKPNSSLNFRGWTSTRYRSNRNQILQANSGSVSLVGVGVGATNTGFYNNGTLAISVGGVGVGGFGTGGFACYTTGAVAAQTLQRLDATLGNGSSIGQLKMLGRNASGTLLQWASFSAVATTTTAGSEETQFVLSGYKAGALVNYLTMTSSATNLTTGTFQMGGVAHVTQNLDTTVRHIITSGTVPTVVAGVAAGTSPTISITGNDTAFTVSLTTGTAPTTGQLFRVTFGTAFGASPVIVSDAGNATTQVLSGTSRPYVTMNSSIMDLNTSGAALAASTAYVWRFVAIQ